jgi:hypothetical protein
MDIVPDDVISYVLTFSTSDEICAFVQTSRRMENIGSANFLWKEIFFLKYGVAMKPRFDCKNNYKEMNLGVNRMILDYQAQ